MKNLLLVTLMLLTLTSYSQVNVIFTINKPDKVQPVADSLNFQYVELERMTDGYSIVISHIDSFPAIRAELNKGANLNVIGGWDMQGNALIMPNPQDNHSRNKFKSKMKKKKTFDINGDLIEERDYTDEELGNGVVNEIAGWSKKEF